MENSKFFEKLLSLFLKFKNESYKCRNGISNYIDYILNDLDFQNDLAVYPTKNGESIFITLKYMVFQNIELKEENLINQLKIKKIPLSDHQNLFNAKEQEVFSGEAEPNELDKILLEFGKAYPNGKSF